VLLGGCSKKYQIEIESDTCWTGSVNNDQSITDCGNSRYKVVGALRCVRLTKTTANGYLRVRIDGRPWAETTEANGTVQACE
jgi:hypothetical protein